MQKLSEKKRDTDTASVLQVKRIWFSCMERLVVTVMLSCATVEAARFGSPV